MERIQVNRSLFLNQSNTKQTTKSLKCTSQVIIRYEIWNMDSSLFSIVQLEPNWISVFI